MATVMPEKGADRVWRAAAAALLIVIGVVHLHLWLSGYRYLATIGPFFLLDMIGAALLAIVVAVRINAVIALAAASLAAGTLGANVLSLLLPDGLFHFKEAGVSYSGGFAIASEAGVVVLVATWTYLRWRRRQPWSGCPAVPSESSKNIPPSLTAMGARTGPFTAGSAATPLHISNHVDRSRPTRGSIDLSQRKDRGR